MRSFIFTAAWIVCLFPDPGTVRSIYICVCVCVLSLASAWVWESHSAAPSALSNPTCAEIWNAAQGWLVIDLADILVFIARFGYPGTYPKSQWVLLGKPTKKPTKIPAKNPPKLNPISISCSTNNETFSCGKIFKPMNLQIFGYLFVVDSV